MHPCLRHRGRASAPVCRHPCLQPRAPRQVVAGRRQVAREPSGGGLGTGAPGGSEGIGGDGEVSFVGEVHEGD